MAKIELGSLDGVFRVRMQSFTIEQLRNWADQLESQNQDAENTEDPEWLQRWANRINRLADRKEQSIEHKQLQSQRQRRQRREHPDANIRRRTTRFLPKAATEVAPLAGDFSWAT
jgi:hypothetical protein